MGLLRKIICPKCGEEYSSLRPACPKCGARKQTESTRTAAPSDTARANSPATRRKEEDSKWQLIFGLCILAAVIIAVIVLIVTTINGGYGNDVAPSQSPSDVLDESPTPPPTQTPTPSPTLEVESLTIKFLGSPTTEFSMHVGQEIQLEASVTPEEAADDIKWSSSNESVCIVDSKGSVKAIGSGSAIITVTCYEETKECSVLVW